MEMNISAIVLDTLQVHRLDIPQRCMILVPISGGMIMETNKWDIFTRVDSGVRIYWLRRVISRFSATQNYDCLRFPSFNSQHTSPKLYSFHLSSWGEDYD